MAIKKIYIPFFSVIIILLASLSAYADFYRHTDENGVVHITNVPRAGYSWMMAEKRTEAPARPDRRAEKKRLDEMIYLSAARHGIDPALVMAVVRAESDYDSRAVSAVGARGLMQLMPETARLMGVVDIHDPEDNIEGGIRYLSRLLEKFEWKVPLALAAYNAGEKAVERHKGVPPYAETQDFVRKVLDYYRVYRGSR
ncbi:MAG: transglycosylase SLT domain-containing protein [Deltaproteobacteria bacterium]|nr:transglycosylase SLT domain-containing protein [Deltaproteobacteria bacterium]